jgi:hypothetical protein
MRVFRQLLLGLFVLMMVSVVVQAQEDDQIAVGDTVEDEATGTVVAYEFEIDEGDSVVFSIEADFSPVLSVEGEDREVYVNSEELYYTDLPMLFTAPSSGTYTLIVGALYDDPEGDFTLRMESADVTSIEYGDSVDLEPESQFYYLFDFEGAEDDVINIYANSEEDDTKLRLILPNGTLLTEDDDNGPRTDPYLRRYILPDDGRYIIILSSLTNSYMMETPITLNLEQTEVLQIAPQPSTIELGGDGAGDTETEVLVFDEAEAGESYRLTIETDRADTSLSVEVNQGDDALMNYYISNPQRIVVDFAARSSSRIVIAIDNSAYDTAAFLDVSLTVVE